MNRIGEKFGHLLAKYLEKPSRKYETFTTTRPEFLEKCLQPGDVLLVEGNLRVSVAIKYITQSTWSHAALYVGNALSKTPGEEEPLSLVEADLREGVIAVPLSKYACHNTRICRPVGLSEKDTQTVVHYAIGKLGDAYDLKNVIDLARYLLPTPPVPVRWRRRLLALGSGDPTRAICSTLIAQAFQAVGYPILPEIREVILPGENGELKLQEILHIRHHSLFTPRDFDISPYFEIVKPTIAAGFDYRNLVWDKKNPAMPASTG